MSHSSITDTLKRLRQDAPDAPFLALGQTVFWDEPLKAAWRRLLDTHWPDAKLIAGVHDTDYFAKTTAHVRDDQQYIALPHDDGRTRGLWSAAGELSALFGSEDLPTRAVFESFHVAFDRLAASDPRGKSEFYAETTSAWGWRGVVQTSGGARIAHDLPLLDYGPALLDLLDWGFAESLSMLAGETKTKAEVVCQEIRCWVTEFLADCTAECTLSDLYQALLPKFYQLLLNEPPRNFETTRSVELLRFNSETYSRPRFAFVNLFLDPATQNLAAKAYSRAVAGGGMYALDAFGEDALPFDVVVPGLGRGTLHVHSSSISIDFAPNPITIATDAPVQNLEALARILETRFGPDVVLVGKAVSLISMLSREFVMVFHETASGYTDRTQAMNEELRRQGISVPTFPLVRLAYPTWDALASVPDAAFHLPPHLASSFGASTVTAQEFAQNWRMVVQDRKDQLQEIKTLSRVRDTMVYLEPRDKSRCWECHREDFERLTGDLRALAQRVAPKRTLVASLRSEAASLRAERQELEFAMGDDFRQTVQPLREANQDISEQEARRHEEFVEPLRRIRERLHDLSGEIRTQRRLIRAIERSPEALEARQTIAHILSEIEHAKIEIIRAAYLTKEGLPHMNARPTAWWLPLVDSSGRWFDAIAEGAQARLEEV